MKNIIKPVLAGFISGALFFGVGAVQIMKVGIPGNEPVGGTEIANAQIASGEQNPQCFDNYTTWYSSTTRKTNADWSTWFAITTVSPYRLFNNFERDINGDGLPDYMWIDHATSNGANGMRDCVYLSNGHGWTKAYQCVAIKANTNVATPVTYYGDCAQ